MKNRAKLSGFLPILLVILLASISPIARADGGVSLYTPYTKISVPPGESIDYSIDIKNSSDATVTVDVSLSGLPKEWSYSLKAGGYAINQISLLPDGSKTLSLNVSIPMKVNKGNHSFRVVARDFDVLPLVINVSEQGTFKTEFTSDQINMQGHAKAEFNFTTKLKNQTGENQVYALAAAPPRGWNVIFKPNYKQATAVEVTPNSTVNVSVEVKPPFNVEAGTYKIPIEASNRSTAASVELEVVITGSYEMELTTPTGLLSTRLTAGNEKRIELLAVNTGSSELQDIVLRSSNPKNWEVGFEPDTIPSLKAGEKVPVFATLKAYEKAIPGDYVSTLTAQTSEVSSKATFRISVKTPLLWGWLGVIIILAALGVIIYLFRKFGRR